MTFDIETVSPMEWKDAEREAAAFARSLGGKILRFHLERMYRESKDGIPRPVQNEDVPRINWMLGQMDRIEPLIAEGDFGMRSIREIYQGEEK